MAILKKVCAGVAGLLLAPARCLERARGWKRVGLLVVYLVIGSIGVAGLAWEGQVRRLPMVGEPPEVARLRDERVPDDRNAFVLYKLAADAEDARPIPRRSLYPPAGKITDWAQADEEIRAWVAQNRPTMDLWLRATERPEASVRNLEGWNSFGQQPDQIQWLFELALLEASRLRDAGDIAGAWRWHRAGLRFSRQTALQGGIVAAIYSQRQAAQAAGAIGRWLDDPRVDPGLLRQALADVDECRRSPLPVGESLAIRYLDLLTLLDRDPWAFAESAEMVRTGGQAADSTPLEQWMAEYPQVRYRARREDGRSRRVLAVVFRNWIEGIHRQQAGGPPPSLVPGSQIPLYLGIGPLPDDRLVELAKASYLAPALLMGDTPDLLLRSLETARDSLDNLAIRLAERLFSMERGREAESLEELVPDYLEALPEKYRETGG